MNLKIAKKVHIIGIGGAGNSAVARFLMSQGCVVSGSDISENESTKALQKLGAVISIGDHNKDNVTKGTNMLIYSSAVPETNPERQQAGKMKIPNYDYHEFLGKLTDGATTIVVGGTHGKTTTTAMLGLILGNSPLKCTTLVGSPIRDFDNSNLQLKDSKCFVIEGDEYNKGILHLNPQAVILTNVEHDHFDTYPEQADYFRVFEDFTQKIPDDGFFIYNADDRNTMEYIEKPHCQKASFGMKNTQADLFVKNYKLAHGRQIFKPVYKGVELKDFNIRMPGIYNLYNALGAMLLSFEMGVDPDLVKDALSSFIGATRRFEPIGLLKGAQVISDYAHHPTALEQIIKAAAEFYPDKRIIVYFQPHQKNRTRHLLNEFADVIGRCPAAKFFLNEIYDVSGRSEDIKVSSKDIIKKIKKSNAEVIYVADLEEGKSQLKKEATPHDVILVIGAGDIDSAIREIVVN